MHRSLLRWVVAMLSVGALAGCECSTARPDPDGGVAVCSLTGATSSNCDDPPPTLSNDLCRCGSRYYWDGTSCVSTAACLCYEGCDRLFETDLACEAAYASCRGDAGP